ncbi:MAG: C4-dicarboxylate ABC transporter permease, partial [Pseudonocardiaceae bacterium]|nr:C4-dicarboxylate ABC transporter permease [Pseudonocardiaceae bacterium]
ISMVTGRHQHATVASYERQPGAVLSTVRTVLRRPILLLRSSVIGTVIGLLPGAGSPVAALVSYAEAVRWSRDKKKFGKGAVEGVAASEAANSACAPASMIPLVGLGVPGSAPAAIIGGALILHGLQPGPSLFRGNSTLVYEFGWLMILAGIGVYLFGSLTSRLLAQVVNMPVRLLAP